MFTTAGGFICGGCWRQMPAAHCVPLPAGKKRRLSDLECSEATVPRHFRKILIREILILDLYDELVIDSPCQRFKKKKGQILPSKILQLQLLKESLLCRYTGEDLINTGTADAESWGNSPGNMISLAYLSPAWYFHIKSFNFQCEPPHQVLARSPNFLKWWEACEW